MGEAEAFGNFVLGSEKNGLLPLFNSDINLAFP